MYYVIVFGIGVVLGVVISRVLDSKFDKIQTQLQELLDKVKK
jgi:uncharacterized membrane-anchored protein YhcB (DUF1043 family)